MSYGLLSDATVPAGLLAERARALANFGGSIATVAHEDPFTKSAPTGEPIKIMLPVRSGHGFVTRQLAGGFGGLEVVDATSETQGIRIRPARGISGLLPSLVRRSDAASVTGSCPLPSMLERFTEALRSYAHRLPFECTRAFTLQLRSLLASEEEFRQAHVYPSVGSFKGLLEFLRADPSFKHPNLSIDSKGRFVASWMPHPRAKLSLTFAGVTDGTWVAADRSPGVKARASGSFSVSAAGGIPGNFASWMKA